MRLKTMIVMNGASLNLELLFSSLKLKNGMEEQLRNVA